MTALRDPSDVVVLAEPLEREPAPDRGRYDVDIRAVKVAAASSDGPSVDRTGMGDRAHHTDGVIGRLTLLSAPNVGSVAWAS
jgi:hypothetical protein